MQKRLFSLFVVFAALVSLCGVSCAAESSKAQGSEIVFGGKLTVVANGKNLSIDGERSIQMPNPFRIETQDDDPEVLVMLLKEEGYTSQKAPIIVNSANAFTVSGKRVNGVFAIQNGKLNSIGGKKSPYRIPAKAGDYYIGIKKTPKEEKEEKSLDAGILLYVKVTVK